MDETVRFSYSKSPLYMTVAANGAHGGVTGRGDFRMDLFVESVELPEEIIHSVTPDGVGPEIDRMPNPPIIMREAQVGVVMQVDQAKSLAYWILDRIKAAEAMSGKSS